MYSLENDASPGSQHKPYKGKGMEGWIARWYARTRQNDIADFHERARALQKRLRNRSCLLEVAPGPGYFAIELAKLGDFRITGLDISRTFVDIARGNARHTGVNIDFRLGNAAAMPFSDSSFDFVYCSAAFKNFSEPVKALNEMYRVLRPGGEACIDDLRKDASLADINSYIKQSGRNWFDAWLTEWTFRLMLIKWAYSKTEFQQMAQESLFSGAEVNISGIGLEVRLRRPIRAALDAS